MSLKPQVCSCMKIATGGKIPETRRCIYYSLYNNRCTFTGLKTYIWICYHHIYIRQYFDVDRPVHQSAFIPQNLLKCAGHHINFTHPPTTYTTTLTKESCKMCSFVCMHISGWQRNITSIYHQCKLQWVAAQHGCKSCVHIVMHLAGTRKI